MEAPAKSLNKVWTRNFGHQQKHRLQLRSLLGAEAEDSIMLACWCLAKMMDYTGNKRKEHFENNDSFIRKQ